jgi:hypothetical protein
VFPVRYEHHLHMKSKTISVSDLGDLYGYEMLRILYCVYSLLTDGDEVVSLTHRSRSTPKFTFYFRLCYPFLLETE